MTPIEQLKSVLCDPEGKCCITGSDEDRAIIDRALQALEAPVLCCGKYETCIQACTHRGKFLGARKAAAQPAQRTEQNFCSRCGKRLASGFVEISIHTCTPPQEKNT